MALTEASAFKDGTIKESDLDITNSGSDGQFLKKAGTQFTWDTVDTSIADDSIAEVKLDIHNAPSGTDKVLGYTSNGMEWTVAAAGATGGGTDKIFWENGQTVTTNYTITNNNNAGTFGPVTINSGVTVTIGDGEYWTII
jgi:hypothetical protein